MTNVQKLRWIKNRTFYCDFALSFPIPLEDGARLYALDTISLIRCIALEISSGEVV